MDLYITHAWAPEDFLLKGRSKLAGNALRCDFNNPARVCTNACASQCVTRVFFSRPCQGFSPKVPGVSVAMMPYGILCRLHLRCVSCH